MKKALGWLICLVVFFSPLLAWAAPKAVIDENRIILDEPVIEGESVRGTFMVANKGDEELRILKIVPG